jgi:hypothetical protein
MVHEKTDKGKRDHGIFIIEDKIQTRDPDPGDNKIYEKKGG